MTLSGGKADAIFEMAFSGFRDPRSQEYREGVLDVLRHRLGEASSLVGKYKYTMGTVQADAYFAGCDEGHRLANEYTGQNLSE